jgi:Dimethlysulfonioproprionate lyase
MATSPEPTRAPALQTFLDAAEAAVMADAVPGSAAARAAGLVFDRTRSVAGAAVAEAPHSLPVCREWLDPALAMGIETRRADVAHALAEIAPRLHWTHRAGSETAAPTFRDGHANALILGPRGIELRDDVWIGVTLMAPGTTYVDHDHPPEEVYLSLTPGEWWNAGMDWTDPGTAGLIYNPPGIRHAMRAGAAPFLALWFLPV